MAVALLATSVPARGQQPAPTAAKDKAYAIYLEGVEHYVAGRYTQALAEYKRALAVYAHPRIELQIAKTLALGMGKPAQAYPYLARVERALARLQPDERIEAQRLRNSLLGQIGFVQVGCATPGVDATLDGKTVSCGQSLVLTVGRHQLVGNKTGFLPRTVAVFVEPRKRATVTLRLLPRVAASRRVRYWSQWKPWAVVAGGVVVAAAAIPLQLRATDNFDRFTAAVDAECGSQRCTPSDSVLEIQDKARLQNRAAIAMWITGGTALAGGLLLTYLNRERTELIEQPDGSSSGVSVAPLLGRGWRGVSVRASF